MQGRVMKWFRGESETPAETPEDLFGADMAPAPAALAVTGPDRARTDSRPFTSRAEDDAASRAGEVFEPQASSSASQ